VDRPAFARCSADLASVCDADPGASADVPLPPFRIRALDLKSRPSGDPEWADGIQGQWGQSPRQPRAPTSGWSGVGQEPRFPALSERPVRRGLLPSSLGLRRARRRRSRRLPNAQSGRRSGRPRAWTLPCSPVQISPKHLDRWTSALSPLWVRRSLPAIASQGRWPTHGIGCRCESNDNGTKAADVTAVWTRPQALVGQEMPSAPQKNVQRLVPLRETDDCGRAAQ